jgi:hypothetical protein
MSHLVVEFPEIYMVCAGGTVLGRRTDRMANVEVVSHAA